mgnify:CR=1 FL=1
MGKITQLNKKGINMDIKTVETLENMVSRITTSEFGTVYFDDRFSSLSEDDIKIALHQTLADIYKTHPDILDEKSDN